MDRGKLICQICGKLARGLHYNVLACLGCKGFYKRAITKKIVYKCYFGGTCSTDAKTSLSRCRACRLAKCSRLGMRMKGLEKHSSLSPDLEKSTSPENIDIDQVLPTISANDQTPRPKHSKSFSPELTETPLEPGFVFPDSMTSTRARSSTCTPAVVPVSSIDAVGDEIDEAFITELLENVQQPDENGGKEICMSPRTGLLSDLSAGSGASLLSLRIILDRDFEPFPGKTYGRLSGPTQHTTATVAAVRTAVRTIFIDQIETWTECRDRAFQLQQLVVQPDSTLEQMVVNFKLHNYDFCARMERFANMLPGMGELPLFYMGCSNASWKFLVFWMIHHAPFMTNLETFTTVGPEQLPFCRFWQEIISEWPLLTFIYQFCSDFRQIGLDQTEQYLVMAVVMSEPAEENKFDQLEIIHRHYATVLLEVLKQRRGPNQLRLDCEKLEHSLTMLKTACRLWHHYEEFRKTYCPASGHFANRNKFLAMA